MKLSKLIFILIAFWGISAMSVADFGKVYVFSAISGTVKKDGKPLEGIRLIRKARWQKEQSDSSATDENGYFSFPAMTERSIVKYLPQEFVASQLIEAEIGGETIEIWSGVKREPEENAESRGGELIVECEMLREPYLKEVDGSAIVSRCLWDAEADEIDTGF